ncbi:uncharacterized protein F4822DRAFT_198182 [Hypoxylon trugodes]|uniref:uncharacterized protein n=1 Tax=Hypoxylon trugodes TaxID=326681 RepID=UPI00219E9884|nr:uncharacterized protein F4822DRAFT_198182 [Hypoxylon trugodes]KAI1389350.1 hypothetical protein F4822DRAFT_198182 [Hypoxylon trugodes]
MAPQTIEVDAPMAPRPQVFPQELPPRPQPTSWRERNCPGFRGCWHFSWEAYSLNTSDISVLARRICMITILGVRTALSILGLFFRAYSGAIIGMVIGSILAVLGFIFVAWCLARIGEATGTRKVFGIGVGRLQFDIFLLLAALIHIGILTGIFNGMSSLGFLISWYGMWLLIFAVAWITSWTPEEANSYV